MVAPAIKLALRGDDLVLTGRVPLDKLDAEGLSYRRSTARDGRPCVIVPWTTLNARALARHDLPAISRIALDYKYPAENGIRPKDYQYQASDFLAKNARAYLLLDMGLGKTLVALWTIDYLLAIGIIKKVLVIAPKTIMWSAWYDEIKTHLPHLTVKVLSHYDAAKRREFVKSAAQVHIINHDGPSYMYKELAAAKYDLIIYDESTAVKNISTNRFRRLRPLLRPNVGLWELTGTPTPQGPVDALGQFKLMDVVDNSGRRVAPSNATNCTLTEKAWRDKVTAVDSGSGYRYPKKNANDIVHRYMQPAFCRTKDEVLPELPRIIYMPTISVAASPEQKAAYTALRKSEKAVGTNGLEVNAVNAAVRVSKIIQIATGCAYAEVDALEAGAEYLGRRGARPVAEFPTAAKDEEMFNIIANAERKSIVYVPFTAPLHRVYERIRANGINAMLIDGAVKPQDVIELINRQFQSTARDAPQVLVAMPQKISHGVTATAATDTIWYSPVVRAEVYQQACNRTDRLGQTAQTRVHHLSGHPTETKLYKNLRDMTLGQRSLMSMFEAFLNEEDDDSNDR